MPQARRIDRETLERIAAEEPGDGPVVSLYLDLDPTQFAIADARASAIRSLVDDGRRQIERREDLDHDERVRGLAAIKRVRDLLEGPDFDAAGAHGLAVFCAAEDGMLEVLKLPRPVPSEVLVGRRPFVEPLVDLASGGRWCVLLVDRERARVLRGSSDHLDEVAASRDEPARGQHDQGGFSQPRYQRGVEEDVDDHLRRTAELLRRRFERAPFDHLVLGADPELAPRIGEQLTPQLRERLVDRIDVDVERAGIDDVLERIARIVERQEAHLEREAIQRLHERLDDGRAASGLEDVLAALNERRVEQLVLEPGFVAAGAICPHCGWLGPEASGECPADGTRLEPREDLAELAIDRAFTQSAAVVIARQAADELARRGGIAAISRF